MISVFMGHQLSKEDELSVANVTEGEQIHFLEGLLFFVFFPDMMQFP